MQAGKLRLEPVADHFVFTRAINVVGEDVCSIDQPVMEQTERFPPQVTRQPGWPVDRENTDCAHVRQPSSVVPRSDLAILVVAIGLLARLGCDVVWAESGHDALAMVQTRQVQLIFMDIQLPDIDGLMVTQRLREQGGWLAGVPIVAMTAGGAEDDRQRCLSAGMNDYITKPLSLSALSNVLALQLLGTPEEATYRRRNRFLGGSRYLNGDTLAMLKTTLGEVSLTQLIVLYHPQVSDYCAQLAACLAAAPLNTAQEQQVARLAPSCAVSQ